MSYNVIWLSALLHKSFCSTLYNKLIGYILVYLGLLHNDNSIKSAHHNIIHLSHSTMSVCYTKVFAHICISIAIFKHSYYLHRYRYLYLLYRYITILHHSIDMVSHCVSLFGNVPDYHAQEF